MWWMGTNEERRGRVWKRKGDFIVSKDDPICCREIIHPGHMTGRS